MAPIDRSATIKTRRTSAEEFTIGLSYEGVNQMGRSDARNLDPEASRRFAVAVVLRLREAGHEAFWAGGCVRDELLGRTPADYDVATAALPDVVRGVFGTGKTLAVGASFGVITVLGPRGTAPVEVATYRADAPSSDGRHPDGVRFTVAREDALRRDFTINGMFLDPLTGAVHDHVGGRADLAAGVIRAIGTPALRFAEDHLRILRAVRFAAAFGFVIERETWQAIERMARTVTTVSPERVADELTRMATRPGRRQALGLLAETGLAAHVLGEFAAHALPRAGEVIGALDEPLLASALAVLAWETHGAHAAAKAAIATAARRLRLANATGKLAAWLVDGLAVLGALAVPPTGPWSRLQPWVAAADAPRLADLLRARAATGCGSTDEARWFTAQLERPRDEIDPAPLLSGADLLAAGIVAGPALGRILTEARRLQLDGALTSRAAALAWLVGQG